MPCINCKMNAKLFSLVLTLCCMIPISVWHLYLIPHLCNTFVYCGCVHWSYLKPGAVKCTVLHCTDCVTVLIVVLCALLFFFFLLFFSFWMRLACFICFLAIHVRILKRFVVDADVSESLILYIEPF